MSTTQEQEISELQLDLRNFRTTPQENEEGAIHAMISVNPSRFHAIIESLLDDEYIPTENIICQKQGDDLIVKEGNRRIAAMKLILGHHDVNEFQIPDSIKSRISSINDEWKSRNSSVPCSIYEENESDKVDKIVSLTHGKGDKASRDPWTSVARARHNRDVNNGREDGLNLLEKYIQQGRNINAQQKERWAGDYGVTVLDAALAKIYPRFEYANVTELVSAYPRISHRDKLEDILLAIGLENLGFKEIRREDVDFAVRFGFADTPLPSESVNNGQQNNTDITPQANNSSQPSADISISPNPSSSTPGSTVVAPPTVAPANLQASPATQRPPSAAPINTQRHVNNLLRKFRPAIDRPKIATLKAEMLKLKIKDNPIAFCFLLRSMFEISAKGFCEEKGLPTTESNGKEKTLKQLLTQATGHLTNRNSNTSMVKTLHGALNEISNPNRILSVTSMNQLVHSPNFSIQTNDVCTLFNNVYPLLEAMN